MILLYSRKRLYNTVTVRYRLHQSYSLSTAALLRNDTPLAPSWSRFQRPQFLRSVQMLGHCCTIFPRFCLLAHNAFRSCPRGFSQPQIAPIVFTARCSMVEKSTLDSATYWSSLHSPWILLSCTNARHSCAIFRDVPSPGSPWLLDHAQEASPSHWLHQSYLLSTAALLKINTWFSNLVVKSSESSDPIDSY